LSPQPLVDISRNPDDAIAYLGYSMVILDTPYLPEFSGVIFLFNQEK
jgi:hypothetical protein